MYKVIEFSGARNAEGSLTWGQTYFWNLIEATPPNERDGLNISMVVPVPQGSDVANVLSALSALMSAHEALRTRYRRSDSGEPLQMVTTAGEIEVLMVETEDPTEAVTDQRAAMEKVEFDLLCSLPVRLTLITCRAVPVSIVLVCSHIVADAWAMQLLYRDLVRLMRPGVHEGASFPQAVQPIDRSVFESSEHGRAEGARALGYWRQQLFHFPPSMYEEAAIRPESPRYVRVFLRTPALAGAALILSRRYHVTPTSVVIAAYATLTAHRTGRTESSFFLYSSNRWTPEARTSVGTYAQIVPVRVDVSGDNFSGVARATHKAVLGAYMNGACHPQEITRMIGETASVRGVEIQLDSVLDIPMDPTRSAVTPEKQTGAGIHGLLDLEAQSEFDVLGKFERGDQSLHVKVHAGGIEALADTHYFHQVHLEDFLRRMQRLLIEAAAGSDSISEFLKDAEFPTNENS